MNQRLLDLMQDRETLVPPMKDAMWQTYRNIVLYFLSQEIINAERTNEGSPARGSETRAYVCGGEPIAHD